MPPEDDLVDEILELSRTAWNGAIKSADIYKWLDNFVGLTLPFEVERLHALHLLRHFTYFGSAEVRELLKAIYRDLYRYPVLQQIRENNGNTRDQNLVQQLFKQQLRRTRFLGMGNPSESGSHLLYYFRQENRLHRDLFVYPHQLMSGAAHDNGTALVPADLEHIVFIDDLLGSGQQATEYGRGILRDLDRVAAQSRQSLKKSYFVMFAKKDGLKVARGSGFDDVQAVHELDESQFAFHAQSRVYTAGHSFNLGEGCAMAERYGSTLFPGNPLGYRNGQMLLAMYYNVPDNTLPIFWQDEVLRSWNRLFRRYPKEVDW